SPQLGWRPAKNVVFAGVLVLRGNFRGIEALSSVGGRQKTWFLPACRSSAEIFAELKPSAWLAAGKKRGFCRRAGPPRHFRGIDSPQLGWRSLRRDSSALATNVANKR